MVVITAVAMLFFCALHGKKKARRTIRPNLDTGRCRDMTVQIWTACKRLLRRNLDATESGQHKSLQSV